MSRLTVIGSWHQSSVLAAGFAELGHEVVGLASDPALRWLQEGRAPVYEPGLDDLLKGQIEAGRLRFTGDYRDGLRDAEFAYVAIDTPVGPDDESDLNSIWEAVDAIIDRAHRGLVVCITSQVPVGTCDQVATRWQQRRGSDAGEVVYVPEFLRLGTALHTFRNADRFVIGSDNPDVAQAVASIYDGLNRPTYLTGRRSAEMGKHAANAFLATSLSFINQVADLCEEVGADVREVAQILRLDRRIGPDAFLGAGLGYAGGTLGREIRALQKLGQQTGVPTDLFDAVDAINGRRLTRIRSRLQSCLSGLKDRKVAIFGLTYKPGTSTLRRSAALEFAQGLVAAGARVTAYDPLADLGELDKAPELTLYRSPLAAAEGCDAVVLMAPWPDGLRASQLRTAMAGSLVIDTANHMPPEAAESRDIEYLGVGR